MRKSPGRVILKTKKPREGHIKDATRDVVIARWWSTLRHSLRLSST